MIAGQTIISKSNNMQKIRITIQTRDGDIFRDYAYDPENFGQNEAWGERVVDMIATLENILPPTF